MINIIIFCKMRLDIYWITFLNHNFVAFIVLVMGMKNNPGK